MVTVRSKAWICSPLISGIVGFNPTKYTCVFLFFLLCCVGDSSLCDELITRAEKSYRVRSYVCACLIVCDVLVESSRIRRSRLDFLASQEKEYHRLKRLVDFKVSVKKLAYM